MIAMSREAVERHYAEVARMVKEAEENKAADEKRKGDIEVKNKAQTYIDEINRTLNEKGDQIPAEQKEALTKLRDEAQGAIQADDIDSLEKIYLHYQFRYSQEA